MRMRGCRAGHVESLVGRPHCRKEGRAESDALVALAVILLGLCIDRTLKMGISCCTGLCPGFVIDSSVFEDIKHPGISMLSDTMLQSF